MQIDTGTKCLRFVDKATILGHDAASISNLFPLVQRKIAASASTVSCLVKSLAPTMRQKYSRLNVFYH
jgi:hypothetical protein